MLLSWTAAADNGGSPSTLDYYMYTDGGLGAGFNLLASSTNKLNSYTVNGLTTGTIYYFKI